MRKHKVGDVVKFRKDLIDRRLYGIHEVQWNDSMNTYGKESYAKIVKENDFDGYYITFVDSHANGNYVGNGEVKSSNYIDEFFEDEPIKETDTITVIPKGDGLTVKASSSIFTPKTFTFTLTESEKELLSKIVSNVSILDYDDWLLDDSETNLGECHTKLQDLVSLYNKISSK